MKIAFVNRMIGFTRGGGEIWDLKIAEGLTNRGADVTFYLGKPLYSELPMPVEQFDSVEIPTPHLQNLAYAAPRGIGGLLADIDSRSFCRRVADQMEEEDVDLIQICSRPEFGRYVDTLEVPVSIVMHGTPYSLWHDVIIPGGSTYDLLESFDQVIATGATTASIREHSNAEVQTINPGVDTDLFSPDQVDKHDSKAFTLLTVGRLVPVKNHPLLLESFSRIAERHPEAKLLIAGDGPLRDRLESVVEKRNIGEKVTFLGHVSHQQLPRLYNRADIFILTSLRESFGMTLIEAMSCGLPVVAPRIGVILEIVDHNENGLLYAADSERELTSAIERMMSDAKLRDNCARKARSTVIDAYDWQRSSDHLYQIYDDLISTHGML